MATIAQIVQQIRTATYGIDVREAIAEGIEKCYDETSQAGTIAAIQAAAEAAIASLPADYSAMWSALAPAFRADQAYSVGEYVTFDNAMYRFTSPHAAGAWNSSEVELTTAWGQVSALNSEMVAAVAEAEGAAGDAEEFAHESEAWAIGTVEGVDVSSEDPAYNNNAKFYAQVAAEKAVDAETAAAATIYEAEAWAKGSRNSVDVSSDDETYHNNSKYYSEQAASSAISANDAKNIVLGMSAEAVGLEPSEPAYASYDSETGVMTFGIPRGIQGNPGDISATVVAPTFSESSAYNVGDIVYYDGFVRIFTAYHAAGEWNPSHATTYSLSTLLQTSLNGLANRFSESVSYSDGKMVIYGASLIKFLRDHAAGPIQSSEYTITNIADQFTRLESDMASGPMFDEDYAYKAGDICVVDVGRPVVFRFSQDHVVGSSYSGEGSFISISQAVSDLNNIVRTLAPVFDESLAYTTGQYVIYNGQLYKFIANKSAGAWNPNVVESVTGGLNDISRLIALPFNATTTYYCGNYVIYNDKLYRFKTNHAAGAWNPDHVTETRVDLLADNIEFAIALKFSESLNYSIGQLTYYNGFLYRFIENHTAGVWNPDHVLNTMMSGITSTIENDIAPGFLVSSNYSIGDYVTYLGQLYVFTADHSAGAWDSSHVASASIGHILNNKLNADDIANVFSATKIYYKGDYVDYNGKLYKFISDHAAGAWNDNHAALVKVGEELKDIYNETISGFNAAKWARGSISISNGSFIIDSSINYRVHNVESILFETDTDISVADGYVVYPCNFIGSTVALAKWYSSGIKQGTFTVNAGSRVLFLIRRATETTDIADVEEFANALTFKPIKTPDNSTKLITRNLWKDSNDSVEYTGVSCVRCGTKYHVTITTAGANKGMKILGFDASNYVGKRIYINATMKNATFNATTRLRLNTRSKTTLAENGTQKLVTMTNGARVNTYFDVVQSDSYFVIGIYGPTSSTAVGNSWDIEDIQCEIGRHTSYIPHEVYSINGSLTPELFGAVGDGVTDDSGPIQDLMKADKSIVFPSQKTYICSNIELRDYQSVNLNGSMLKTTSDAPIFITSSSDDALNYLHIFNGHLSGDSSDNTKTAQQLIYLSSFYSTYENLTFRSCYVGLHLIPRTNGSDSSTVENVFRNLKFNSCYHTGLYLNYEGGITDSRVEGIFANAPTGALYNIYVGQAAGLIMSNLHLYGTPGQHIHIRSTAHTFIDNSYIEGSYMQYGIWARLTRTLTIANTIFIAARASTTMLKIDDLGASANGYRFASLNGITFESYADLGEESVTPISLGVGCKATGSNLVINDVYGSISDIDEATGLTAIRLE